MFNSIRDYLQTRRKSKLYRQWVEQSALPTEDLPDELSPLRRRRQDYPSADDSDLTYEDFPGGNIHRLTRPQDVPHSQLLIPIRYVMLAGSAILLLLVIISVLSTVLIMRSC